METRSVYYLVCLKKDKQYVLRDKYGNDHKLDQFNLRKISFFQRTRETLFMKCGSILYHIDITDRDDENQLKKEKVEDVLYCIHKGMLISFDGQVIGQSCNNTWRNVTLDQSLNDVTLLYSYKKSLMAFGTNINEEPRLLKMRLVEQPNTAKRIKRSESFESIEQEPEEDESETSEDESSLKISYECFKIEKTEKVIAFQYFEEEDRDYLFYILLNESHKKYKVFIFPNRRISLSRKPTSLLGFVYFSRTLYVYGIEKGSLLFYKYNCNHRFELVRESDNPKFFKRNETDSVFRIVLSKRELNLLKQGTFRKIKLPKTFTPDEVKNLIVTGKRNASKPRPSYCELTDSDNGHSEHESEFYYDSDQLEYLSSSTEEEEEEEEESSCESCASTIE